MGESKSRRTFDKKRIEALASNLAGQKARITEIKKSRKRIQAPLLYDLTELQRDADKRYQYSAKETLNICQRLYENHKVLTYPRTDSRYLSSDIVSTIGERLKACSTGPYRKLGGCLINQPRTEQAYYINNGKVSDHHAMIPTEEFVQLDHMSIDERRIYDLVVRRFFAVQYPAYEYEEVRISVSVGSEIFTSSVKRELERGWKEVYEEMSCP